MVLYKYINVRAFNIFMRQNIKNNWITSIIAVALVVIAVLIVAGELGVIKQEPVSYKVEQETAITILQQRVDNGFETMYWLFGVVAFVLVGIVGFSFYTWGRVNELYGKLKHINFKNFTFGDVNDANVADRNSPLVLNRQGKFLLQYTGANKYIDNHFDDLCKELCREMYKNANTQTGCEASIQKLRQEKEFNVGLWAKRVIGQKQYDIEDEDFQEILQILDKDGIDYNAIALAMSLKLRDKIYEGHNKNN